MWAEPDCYAFSALQFVPTDLDKGQVGLMLGSWIVIPMPCLWSESYMLWSVIPMPCLWSDICSADMLGIYIYALKRHPHALLLKWYICSPQICWAYIYIYICFDVSSPCLTLRHICLAFEVRTKEAQGREDSVLCFWFDTFRLRDLDLLCLDSRLV